MNLCTSYEPDFTPNNGISLGIVIFFFNFESALPKYAMSFENSASAIYVEGPGSVYRVSSGHLTFSSSGGATCALNCRQFGYAEISGRTVNFSGTPSYAAATVLAAEFGFCRLTALSFTGASAGKRYDVSRKAMIFTNSASDTYLPGTASGSSSADGLYV